MQDIKKVKLFLKNHASIPSNQLKNVYVQFFSLVIKLQNLNEVLLKGFQLGCKINDLCTNLHPSLVGVLTEIGRQECNWLKFFAPNVTTKSNWLQSSGGGLAPHNAYTTMDASSFPPLQSAIIERRWLPSILHMRISMVLIYNIIFQGQSTQSPSSNFCNCVLFFNSIPFFLYWKKGWLWWWCSRLVIEMQLLNLGNPFYL